MTDREALDRIAEWLNNPEPLEDPRSAIAAIVQATGREILNEEDAYADDPLQGRDPDELHERGR